MAITLECRRLQWKFHTHHNIAAVIMNEIRVCVCDQTPSKIHSQKWPSIYVLECLNWCVSQYVPSGLSRYIPYMNVNYWVLPQQLVPVTQSSIISRETLQLQTLHYIIQLMANYYESMVIEKKQVSDAQQWGQR